VKHLWLVVLVVVVSAVSAQMPLGGATAGNQISVMVVGRAEAPAEVVKVHLSIRSQGDTAEVAAMQNQDDVAKVVAELAKAGIGKEAIEAGPTVVGGASFEAMMKAAAGKGGGPQYSASAEVVVTLKDVPQAELPTRVGRIMDAGSVAGTQMPVGPQIQAAVMSAMTGAGGPVRFEAKDPEALERAAMADGLKRAQTVAEQTAKMTGKKLVGMEGVTVLAGGFDWFQALGRMFGGRQAPPWKVQKTITLLVSYSYEK